MNAEPPVPWQMVSDTLCASGQAPFWHAQEERLYWIDALLKRVWRHHLLSGRTEHWDLPRPASGVAPCRAGGLLLVMDDGVFHANAWLDVPTQIAALPTSRVAHSLRGGRCDPWGRLWLASLPADAKAHAQSDALGSLYCLAMRKSARPELYRVRGSLGDIHGWAWSPDGRNMYWCDAGVHQVQQAAMSMPGSWPPELAMPFTLTRFAPPSGDQQGPGSPRPAYAGYPSSGALDRAGRYWVAMMEGGRVLRLNDKGQVELDIPTPVLCPSGLCFGGADMQTLFITSTRAHRSPEELAAFPQSGGVFALKVSTPGMPLTPYWD